jgi:uncharacterized protein YidB (DUF937 family)
MADTNVMLKSLLGLAAVAAWQNRDKISDFVKGMGSNPAAGSVATNPGGAIGGLVDMLKKSGLGAQADSWVAKGPNQPVTPTQIGQGIDGGMLDQIAAQTGIPKDELLTRLSQVLPGLVDQMTPNGSLHR